MKKCYVREKSESYIMRFEKTALEIFQNLSLLAANVMTDSFLQLVLQKLSPKPIPPPISDCLAVSFSDRTESKDRSALDL